MVPSLVHAGASCSTRYGAIFSIEADILYGTRMVHLFMDVLQVILFYSSLCVTQFLSFGVQVELHTAVQAYINTVFELQCFAVFLS